MKLYGSNLSPYVRKTMTVLAVKGLDFEHEAVLPRDKSAAFRAISPGGKIPAMEDGDLAFTDSSAICEYLDEICPEPPTMPRNPQDRARARWLEEYADSYIVHGAGVLFFERFAKPMLMGMDPDEANIQRATEKEIPGHLDYLEKTVPAEGFMFGELGAVDISLITHFIQASYAGYEIDAARWPNFAAYMERVKAHPAVAGVLATEAEILKAMGG